MKLSGVNSIKGKNFITPDLVSYRYVAKSWVSHEVLYWAISKQKGEIKIKACRIFCTSWERKQCDIIVQKRLFCGNSTWRAAAIRQSWHHFHGDAHDNHEAVLNKPTTLFMTLTRVLVTVISICCSVQQQLVRAERFLSVSCCFFKTFFYSLNSSQFWSVLHVLFTKL